VRQRELASAHRLEEAERGRSLHRCRAEHDRSSTPLAAAGHAILAERELVVQPVGTRDVELERARLVREVGEFARREMPDERRGPHPQEGLDRRSHRRASVHGVGQDSPGPGESGSQEVTMGPVTRTSFIRTSDATHAPCGVRSSAMRDLMAVTERPGMISLAAIPWTAAFPPACSSS